MSFVAANAAPQQRPSDPCADQLTDSRLVAAARHLARRVEDSTMLSSLCAVADQAIISGTSFVTAVVIGRCCGGGTLGVYALVTSALAILTGIQDQLITAPYVLYHHRQHGRTRARYRGSVLLHQWLWIAALLGLSGLLVTTVPASATGLIMGRTLAVALPFLLLRAFVREMELAHCRMLPLLLLDAALCGGQLLTLGVLLASGSVNLVTLYAAAGTGGLLAGGLWWSVQRATFRFCRFAVVIHWQRNWRFGRWALATHLAGCSTPYVMPWVLYAVCGESETGRLASASVVVGVANLLLSGLADFLTPRAARAYAEGGTTALRSVLRSMLWLSLLTIGSLCAVAALAGQWVVDLLYDGRFAGTGWIITLLTLSVLANAVGNVAGNGLWALDRPRANFVADMMTLITAIAAAPAFIHPYGATGAALSTLIACTMGAALRQLILQQALRESGRQSMS